MKLIARKEFLDMPSGTLFHEICSEKDHVSDQRLMTYEVDNLTGQAFTIKGATTWQMNDKDQGDFNETDFPYRNSGAVDEEVNSDPRQSFAMNMLCGRNALYDRDAMFLIYEHDDLVLLRKVIDDAIENLSEAAANKDKEI